MEGQNISDVIENYLKNILSDSEHVEIRRSEVADLFDVVPSQINYVIKTRFTIQNGYLVESKRGGGGYIRIEKVNLMDDVAVLNTLIQVIGDEINERDAISIIQTLYNEDVITRREADLMAVTVAKQTLAFDNRQIGDTLRAHILISLLNRLRYES